ncbi:MAG: hypothetical protein BIFFINMI_01474 [Phycisphaerae bacterium]|nr:hypothetical protein [Phycisphaerae bacterium]
MAHHRNRSVVCCFALIVALAGLPAPTSRGADDAPAPALTMRLDPADGQALAAPAPVTFGVVFRPGQIPAGASAVVELDGKAVAAQVDAKRHFADGSLKHAVVSMVLPSLAADGSAMTFAAGKSRAAKIDPAEVAKKLLAGDFDAAIRFKVPEGKTVSASARKMLEAAGDKAALWLGGPVAVEWLLSGPPVDEQGAADADLNVAFHVRYYPALGLARVSAIVELCSDGGSDGGLNYDVTITRGRAKPEAVFEQQAVAQPDMTRWRKVFWVGGQPAGLEVRHDARAMAAAGVIPQFDFSQDVAPAKVELLKHWEGARTGLFQNGLITTYMPMTGGRGDLGVLPQWTTVYLMTMDPKVKRIVLENDELSGGIPIHARERATGRVPFYADHKMLWLCDGRAGRWGTQKWRSRPNPPRAEPPIKSLFVPDPAHLPGLCYVSYVVTGDYWDLEENWFWSTYVLYSDNPGYARGVIIGQLRGIAWSLRTLALTAAISPDGLPETAEFTARTDAALAAFHKWLDDKAMPLGMLTPHSGGGVVNYAPWQHDHMIMATDAAAEAGFKEAVRLRSRLLEFSIGRFTHPDEFDPHFGCGYWWTVGKSEREMTVKTWKDLFAANCEGKKADMADYAGGYADLAIAATSIGVRVGQPDARKALDFLKENSHGVFPGRSRTPVFAYSTVPVR